MATRGMLGSCLVWFLIQVDALSPSASFSSHNTNYSADMDIDSTPTTGQYFASSSQSTNQLSKCNSGNFSVCWINRPPYLMKDENTGQITGTFHDAIEDLLGKCCEGGHTCFRLNYTHQAMNGSELAKCMKRSDFDFVFPMLRSQVDGNKYSSSRFQKLIQSPGIAVLKNRKYLEDEAKLNVIQEFFQIWTVLVLALLLNAIFGILIWALDSRSNPEEFPQSFCRGSLEGIWWAFVTMTTVGYGDKAPKFLLARVFGVVWMFMGVAVMAYLTAIMTTALTSGTVTDHRIIINKEFGVLPGSQGDTEGMKQGVIIKPYNDLESLTKGLRNNEVEGVLLDVFTTSYIFNKDDIETDVLEQVKTLEFPFDVGFYLVRFLADRCEPNLKTCIKSKSEEKKSNDIYPTLLKHVQGPTVKGEERQSWRTRLNLFSSSEPFFRLTLYTLSSVLVALIVFGLLWELFTRQKRRNFKLGEQGRGRGVDMDVPLVRRDFKRILEHVSDIEKSLAQISELKAAYYKMEDYSSHLERNQGTQETNLVALK